MNEDKKKAMVAAVSLWIVVSAGISHWALAVAHSVGMLAAFTVGELHARDASCSA